MAHVPVHGVHHLFVRAAWSCVCVHVYVNRVTDFIIVNGALGKGTEKAAKCLAQYTTFRSGQGIFAHESVAVLSGHAQHTCLLISGGRVGGAFSQSIVALPCVFWLGKWEQVRKRGIERSIYTYT